MVDWSFNEHYRRVAMPCWRWRERRARRGAAWSKAGAKYIQIDEPALSTRAEEIEIGDRGHGRRDGQASKPRRSRTSATATSRRSTPRSSTMPVDQLDLAVANYDYRWLDLFDQRSLHEGAGDRRRRRALARDSKPSTVAAEGSERDCKYVPCGPAATASRLRPEDADRRGVARQVPDRRGSGRESARGGRSYGRGIVHGDGNARRGDDRSPSAPHPQRSSPTSARGVGVTR